MKQEYTMESSLSLDETNSSIDINEDHSLKIPPDSSSLVSNVLLDTLDSQDTELVSNISPFQMNSYRDLVEDDRFLSNEEEDFDNIRFENDSNQCHSPSSTNNNDEQLSEQQQQQCNSQDFDKEEELSQDDFEECEEELSEVEEDDEFDDNIMTTDNTLDSYEEYEKEQDQFNREMNRTKIAFAAYRNAVLHLIHNQNYKQKHSTDEIDESQNVNDDDERISKLEELAKAMVETKAKACVDAVLVANEFVERRAARRQRSKMLTEKINGNNNIFAELLKRSKKEKVDDDKSREISCNGFKSTYFRRRTVGRHADCIISTLPKFEFRRDEDDISTDVEEGHSPARYKTSIWIGNMVEWRKQRNEYKESCFRKCSCPDCQHDLKNLLKNDKNC